MLGFRLANISRRTFFCPVEKVEALLNEKFSKLQPQDLDNLKPVVPIRNCYLQLKKAKEEQDAIANEIGKEVDKEMLDFFQEELNSAQNKSKFIQEELYKNLISFEIGLSKASEQAMLEIRAGTGGEEAANFAFEIQEMYQKYCILKGWNWCMVEEKQDSSNSLREGIYLISGKDAFAHLQSETGVHRVQRVPASENAGRIHTSTISVALIPKSAKEFSLNPNELSIETYRACSGPGGQHLNTTSSAVRITHKPSGLILTSMKERCQHANKEIALKQIEAKLYKMHQEKISQESGASRQQQIKGALRCEKIRTYNFPQNRISDHRLGESIYRIEDFMNGKLLDEFSQEFILQRALERLKLVQWNFKDVKANI
jgi:peptide chain release factor 1